MIKATLIVLRSTDLQQARTFYEALGLAFVEERHGSGPRHLATTLDTGLVIELYPVRVGGGPEPAADTRLGFAVSSVPDVLARLRCRGFEVPSTDAATVTVTDPDGRRVALEPGDQTLPPGDARQ